MRYKVIAERLAPRDQDTLRELRQAKAEAEAATAKVTATRARLWRDLQATFDLDLDTFHYRIDAAGRLVQVGSDSVDATEEQSTAVAAMLALDSESRH